MALPAIGERGENEEKTFRARTLATQANCDVDMYVKFRKSSCSSRENRRCYPSDAHGNSRFHRGQKKADEKYGNRPPVGFCCSVRQIILRLDSPWLALWTEIGSKNREVCKMVCNFP